MNSYQKALLKKIAPLEKFNQLAHVFILMRAPYMGPNGFPTELVPAEKIADRLTSEWSIVTRQPEEKNGKHVDDSAR